MCLFQGETKVGNISVLLHLCKVCVCVCIRFWAWAKPTCYNMCPDHTCTHMYTCVCVVLRHSCSAGSNLPGWRQSPEGERAAPLLRCARVAVQMQLRSPARSLTGATCWTNGKTTHLYFLHRCSEVSFILSLSLCLSFILSLSLSYFVIGTWTTLQPKTQRLFIYCWKWQRQAAANPDI